MKYTMNVAAIMLVFLAMNFKADFTWPDAIFLGVVVTLAHVVGYIDGYINGRLSK